MWYVPRVSRRGNWWQEYANSLEEFAYYETTGGGLGIEDNNNDWMSDYAWITREGFK